MATMMIEDGDVTITTEDDLRDLNLPGMDWDIKIKREALKGRTAEQIHTLGAQLLALAERCGF